MCRAEQGRKMQVRALEHEVCAMVKKLVEGEATTGDQNKTDAPPLM